MVEIIEIPAPKSTKKRRKQHKTQIRYGQLNKGNTTSVRRNSLGIPLAAPPITAKLKPNLKVPDTEGKNHLEDERELYDVEVLMVKGVIKVDHIARTLKIGWRKAKKLIERVEYRWAINSNPQQLQQVRGLSKTRLDLITLALWDLHDNTRDDRIKLGSLNQALFVHDRQMILDGVTEKSIEELRLAGSQGDESVEAKMIEHSRILNLSNHLHEYLAKRSALPTEGESDVIEGDFTDV